MRRILIRMGYALDLSGATTGIGVGDAATFTFTASGGQSPYQITMVSTDLDLAEWTFTDNGDGTATLATASADTAGTFTFTLRLRDALRQTPIERTFSVFVQPQALSLTGSPTDAQEGTPYSFDLTRTGGLGAITITAQSGFPTGVTASVFGSTVRISGTPSSGTSSGSPFSPSVSIEDVNGDAATWNGTLAVDAGSPVVTDLFVTTLYTGNAASSRLISGIDLSGGGCVFIKKRSGSGAQRARCYWSADGTTVYSFEPGVSAAVTTGDASFSASGITLLSASQNANAIPYVAEFFKIGLRFCDIVTWTGNGGGARTLSHGLGVQGGMIWLRPIDATSYGMNAWTSDVGTNANNTASGTNAVLTAVTSSDFAVAAAANTNAVVYMAIIFAHDTASDGIIQKAFWTGNGTTTGPDIVLGWQPQFTFHKGLTGGAWSFFDQARSPGFTGSDLRGYFTQTNDETSATSIELNVDGFNFTSSTTDDNGNAAQYFGFMVRAP